MRWGEVNQAFSHPVPPDMHSSRVKQKPPVPAVAGMDPRVESGVTRLVNQQWELPASVFCGGQRGPDLCIKFILPSSPACVTAGQCLQEPCGLGRLMP